VSDPGRKAIDTRLLVLLAVTVLAAGLAARGILEGGTPTGDRGFDGPISVPLVDAADDVPPLVWDPPASPRNPFVVRPAAP
jgi:hypothetical protein